MATEAIVFLPREDLDARGNLEGFIRSCRDCLTAFGADLPFDKNVWDVTDFLELKGHGNKRQRLVFNSFAGIDRKEDIPLTEPFCSFA